MIKTTLPVIEKRIDETTDKLIITEKTIDVNVDTSVYAEARWEREFPNNAAQETLFAYAERLYKQNTHNSAAWALSAMKALYCFIEGEQIGTFKAFCQIFDLAEGEYLTRLVNKIKKVFDIVLRSSAVDEKNS